MKSLLKVLLLIAIITTIQLSYGWIELFEVLKKFAENNANPFAFLAVMSLGCAIGLPISFCTLFAGAAFGSILGSALSIIGIAISSIIGYVIGRFFFPQDYIQKIKNKFSISEKKTMFDLNFYVRAIPGIPYSMQNIILGAMNSDMKLYILLAVSIQGIIAIAMNFLGASFSDNGLAKYIAFASLICVIVAMRIAFKKLFKI